MDKMKKIVIVIPEGNLIVSSVAGTYKLFKAAITHSGKNVELVIAGEQKPQGYLDDYFLIQPSTHWSNIDQTDLIVIPALIDNMNTVVQNNHSLINWLVQQYEKKAILASLCTGSFLLAEAGLLHQKKCTTHWAYSKTFNERYPNVRFQKNNIITEDERIFTSGGAYSFLNLIIYLIERYFTKDIARYLINIFQIDYIRQSQDRFVIFDTQKRHGDQQIISVQNFIEQNYASPIDNEGLAKIAQLGTRTMIRRFKKHTGNTPKQYQQRVRMEAAKDLLITTNKQISEIQYEVGYQDPKFFRAAFSKNTGMLPIAYRRTMVNT